MTMDKQITGRTVLFAMLGFFGVIFAMNGVLTYFAVSSFPGLSTERPYEKGIAYNQTLDDAAKQTAKGWNSQLTLSQDGTARVTIADRQGLGVSGLEVVAVLMRPAQSKLDQRVPMVESDPGQYIGSATPLLKGKWHLQLSASQEGRVVFYQVHTIMING